MQSSSNTLVAPSDGARSATPTESRFRGVATEERERSFSKTQNWLNENWPARDDVSEPEVGAGERKTASDDRIARRMRSDFSNKFEQLSSKYRDLKTRADDAINTLTASSSTDVANPKNRTAALQFATPKRSNKKRLSGEMTSSLSLTRGQVDDAGNASDSGRRSLGNASTASNNSQQLEFLRYHKPPAGASRSVDTTASSARRGPDYWKHQIEQNDNNLLRAPAQLAPASAENVLSESRLREQILRESDARIAADRHMGL